MQGFGAKDQRGRASGGRQRHCHALTKRNGVLADLLKHMPISGADPLRCRRQDDRYCKVKNRTILIEGWHPDGRRVRHSGYARFLFFARRWQNAGTGERQEFPARAIDTAMKTVDEWLTVRRTKDERLWLNDKNDVVGMSNINPLLQKKAKVKPLKLPKAKLGVALRINPPLLDSEVKETDQVVRGTDLVQLQ